MAGLLKLYLRELPECVFTSKAYAALLQAMNIVETKEKINVFTDIYRKIPEYPNQGCIKYLIDHVIKVGVVLMKKSVLSY